MAGRRSGQACCLPLCPVRSTPFAAPAPLRFTSTCLNQPDIPTLHFTTNHPKVDRILQLLFERVPKRLSFDFWSRSSGQGYWWDPRSPQWFENECNLFTQPAFVWRKYGQRWLMWHLQHHSCFTQLNTPTSSFNCTSPYSSLLPHLFVVSLLSTFHCFW